MTKFKQADRVVAVADIPIGGIFITEGSKGTVAREYMSGYTNDRGSYVVDFEDHVTPVRVFDDEIEKATDEVVLEDSEVTYLVQAETPGKDGVKVWSPWWFVPGSTEEQAKEALKRIKEEDVFGNDYRVARLTTTRKIEVV